MTHPTTVEMTLVAELHESSSGKTGALSVTWAYRADQPYSVFLCIAGAANWEISRDVLREALERSMAGVGDVKFIHHGPSVVMHLESHEGWADFLLDRADLRAFVRATQRVCEFGTEDITGQVDDAIQRFLAGAL